MLYILLNYVLHVKVYREEHHIIYLLMFKLHSSSLGVLKSSHFVKASFLSLSFPFYRVTRPKCSYGMCITTKYNYY
jgi:hypothetical protein